MNAETSEIELLQASLGGSKEAFSAVVERYQALVCAVTYSATGDINRSEELAQETFVRAWKNFRQLGNPGKFRAWLCTIARNLARTSIRDRRTDVVCAAGSLDAAAALPAAVPAPDEAASERERQEIVWAAVGQIPEKYREPLVLFYRQQRSVGRVAADLGLTEHTVRQRLHRGRQLIKAGVSLLVEDTLVRSGPGKAFAVGVIAALPAAISAPASAAVIGMAAKGAVPAKPLVGAGLFGAVLGPILGLPGGVLGTWLSVAFDSPRDRRLMIRWAIVWWLAFFMLIALPGALILAGLVPIQLLWICLAVFFIFQLPLVLWAKFSRRRMRVEQGAGHPSARVTRRGLYASFGGGIFGASVCFLYQAAVAKDWVLFGGVVACGVLLFFVVTETFLRCAQRRAVRNSHEAR